MRNARVKHAEVRSGFLRPGQFLYDHSVLINRDSTCSSIVVVTLVVVRYYICITQCCYYY
jgi:hypothetical protein